MVDRRKAVPAFLASMVLVVGCGEKVGAQEKLQQFCEKDGGITVFERVKVPKEQFDQWGMPRGQNWDRSNPRSTLDPRYTYTYSATWLQTGDSLKGEVEMWKKTEKIIRVE